MKTCSWKYILGIVVIELLALGAFLYYCETSDYIPLDIPAPLSYLPNGNWDGVFYMTEHFVDEYGRVLILRKEGRAYGINHGYLFDTSQNVMDYFKDYLAKEGWIAVRSHIHPFYKCQYGLPEKEYLSNMVFEQYMRKGADPEKSDEKICVAVIPMEGEEGDTENAFKVILISSRYSMLTRQLERLRRW